MDAIALRPRYRFSMPLAAEDIRQKLLAALKNAERNTPGLQYRSVSNHLIIVFPKRHKHFWSPALDINPEAEDNGSTKVRVLIGPEPSIWTMFMFFYAVGGLLFSAGVVLGYVQHMLHHDPWLFLLAAAGAGIILFFYFAALAGKARAREQTAVLSIFAEEALGCPLADEVPESLGRLA